MQDRSVRRGRGRAAAIRGRGSIRGRTRGRGTRRSRGRGFGNKSRGHANRKNQIKRKKERLVRPKTVEKLFQLFEEVPTMMDEKAKIKQLLHWYLELFFDPTHLPKFKEFQKSDSGNAVTKSRIFAYILEKLEQVSSDPVGFLREPYNKKIFPIPLSIHEAVCVTVIIDLDLGDLNEAYEGLSKSMQPKINKAFWQKRKENGSAWSIDQNALPKNLQKEKLQKFGEYVMSMVDRKDLSRLKVLLREVPEKFKDIHWNWGYTPLMYAARCGGAKIAEAFLVIQTAPEKGHKGKSFDDFLQEHCKRFIPIYDAWLTEYEKAHPAKPLPTGCGCVMI